MCRHQCRPADLTVTQASGHRMELIIIALIAVEVCIVLIREGPELYHKVGGWFTEEAEDLAHGRRGDGEDSAEIMDNTRSQEWQSRPRLV